MRHKLLSFLEEALKEGELLEGIVEADEAYVLESQKGIPETTRKPRKHGESATVVCPANISTATSHCSLHWNRRGVPCFTRKLILSGRCFPA